MSQSETSIPLFESNSPQEACDGFLSEVKTWAHACVDRYAGQPPTDGHDQLTYTTGWEPYLIACRDEEVFQFLSAARDETAAHFVRTGAWRHGYWRMQEAHHGTEHFELFLGFLLRVDPGSPETVRQIVDMAEHLGNWSPDVPEWFDHTTGLFRSLYFGADVIREDKHELNLADHLRCANILLLAHDATRERRYLELAESYSRRWAAAICEGDGCLPLGITRDGAIYSASGLKEEDYPEFPGLVGGLQTELDRAENILASGGIQLFLRLWQETRAEVFLDAARRLLQVLSSELGDADAGPVADAIRRFRRITGRRDFDGLVTQAVAKLTPFAIRSMKLALSQNPDRRSKGVGKRADLPVWSEDDRPRRHDPILLALAAEIQEDPLLAARAVDLARTCFVLSTKLLPDGRDHGCAARTVSAVARGHGRNNHAGMTTSVLLPTMEHFGLF